MRLPEPPHGAIIASVSDPLEQLGESNYARVGTDTWLAASELMKRLEGRPFNLETTYMGPGIVGLSPIFFRAEGRYWLLRSGFDAGQLSRCERQAVAQLETAGHKFDPATVRVVDRMPSEWEPSNTMQHIGRAVYGEVEPTRYGVALPLEAVDPLTYLGKRWVSWVAVSLGDIEDH